jgi:hypothetical protein
VGHAPLVVADLPDLGRTSLHYDRVLVRLVAQAVDAPPIFIDQNQACLNYLGLGAGY